MKVMVLNDGETFTSLAGCKIVDVPNSMSSDEIEEAIKAIRDNDDIPKGVRIVSVFNDKGMQPPNDRIKKALKG